MQSALPEPPAFDSAAGGGGPAAASEKANILDHPLLCFEDGDVQIYSASDRQTNARTRYHLHKAVLQTFMPEFGRALSGALDDSDGASIEGRLPAPSLTNLFSFMYPHRDGITPPTWDTLNNVDAAVDLLQLARDLEVPSLQKSLESSIKQELKFCKARIESGDGYNATFTLEHAIRILCYADDIDDDALADLALEATDWIFAASHEYLEDQDLEQFKRLTPEVERRLWVHHTKQRKAKLREAELDRDDALIEKDELQRSERAKKAAYFTPPEGPDQHTLAVCWQKVALPAYYQALVIFLNRLDNDESPSVARTSLTCASYGGCATCMTAINKKIAEIPCS